MRLRLYTGYGKHMPELGTAGCIGGLPVGKASKVKKGDLEMFRLLDCCKKNKRRIFSALGGSVLGVALPIPLIICLVVTRASLHLLPYLAIPIPLFGIELLLACLLGRINHAAALSFFLLSLPLSIYLLDVIVAMYKSLP